MQGSVCGYVVRQATGEPIAGLTIKVSGELPTPADAVPDLMAETSATAITDQMGRFGIDLDEGIWVLHAQDSAGHAVGEAHVRVFDNAVSDVTIEAFVATKGSWQRQAHKRKRTLPGIIHGRVVRADNGNPVSDASITIVRGAKAAPDISPITDSEGKFTFEGLSAGDWTFRAHAGGQTGEATVRVASGATAEITIVVDT